MTYFLQQGYTTYTFPNLHRLRKNIQYLTEEEMSSVKDVLVSEKSSITLRNRAIGMLLFFTGMRSSDIAGLAFSDIDWEKKRSGYFRRKLEMSLCFR